MSNVEKIKSLASSATFPQKDVHKPINLNSRKDFTVNHHLLRSQLSVTKRFPDMSRNIKA